MNSKSPKTVFVTAGAKRIGAHICLGLAKRGFDIALHHHNSSVDAAKVKTQIEALGQRCHLIAGDLTDLDASERAFSDAAKVLGPISSLINNASVFEPDGCEDFDAALWDTHFDVHLKASVRLAQLLHAQKLEHGLVVNIIDQRVLRPGPSYFSYTLSKAALWTATKTLAQGMAPRTRVNAIAPGPTLPNARQSDAEFAAQVAATPLARAPELDEFAATIEYFFNAPSVTGQMICLDSGQHLASNTANDGGGLPERSDG